MSAVRIFGIWFFYTVISAETETIGNQTTTFDNESLTSNRLDSKQVLKSEKRLEDYATTNSPARREGRSIGVPDETTLGIITEMFNLATTTETPTEITRLIPYTSTLQHVIDKPEKSSRRYYNPYLDPIMEQNLKQDSIWSSFPGLNNLVPTTNHLDLLLTNAPTRQPENIFLDQLFTTKSPFDDLLKELDSNQDSIWSPGALDQLKPTQSPFDDLMKELDSNQDSFWSPGALDQLKPTQSPFDDLMKELDSNQDSFWSPGVLDQLPKPTLPSPCDNAKVLQKLLSRLLMLLLRSMNNSSSDLDSINNALDIIQMHLKSDDLQKIDLNSELQGLEGMLRAKTEDNEPSIKTKIIFKKIPPMLNNTDCNNSFLKLMATAYESYTKLSQYPNCRKPETLAHSPHHQPKSALRSLSSSSTPTTFLSYLLTSPNNEVTSSKDTLGSRLNFIIQGLNTIRPETHTSTNIRPALRVRDIPAPFNLSFGNDQVKYPEIQAPFNFSFGNDQVKHPEIQSILKYLDNKPNSDTVTPKVYGAETSPIFLNDLVKDIVTPKYSLVRNEIIKNLEKYGPGQQIEISKLEMPKRQDAVTVKPLLNYFEKVEPTKHTIARQNNVPPSLSQLLTNLEQSRYPDSVKSNVLDLISAVQPEVKLPPKSNDKASQFPWLSPSLKLDLPGDTVSPHFSVDQHPALSIGNFGPTVENFPEFELPEEDIDYPDEKKEGHTVNIYLSSECKDFSEKQKRYLVRLLKHFHLLHPDGGISQNNEELLKLIIRYLKEVLAKLNNGSSDLPDGPLPDDTLPDDILPDDTGADNKLVTYIINLIKSLLVDPEDIKKAIDKVMTYLNHLQKLGVDINDSDTSEEILLFVQNVIKDIHDGKSKTDGNSSGIDQEINDLLLVILNKYVKNNKLKELLMKRLYIYITKLAEQGYDLKKKEVLDQILEYMKDLLAQSIFPTTQPPLSNLTFEEIFKLPGGLDEEVLIYLHKLITSLAPIDQQSYILLELNNYIKQLIKQGTDLKNSDSLKLILIFLKNILPESPTQSPFPQIDKEFIIKLYKYIMSVASEKHRQFVLNKVEEYIKNLLRQGIDLNQPENLNLIIKYVNDVIETLKNLDTATEKPNISEELLMKIDQMISSMVKDLDQIQNVRTQVLTYIQNLLELGFDFNEQETLDLIFIFIKQIVLNLEKYSTEKPDSRTNSTLTLLPPEFLKRIIDLLASSLDEDRIADALSQLDDFIKKLILLGKDLSKIETLKLIVTFVMDIVKKYTVPTNDKDMVDREFLIKLYEFIISSVPSVEEREMIISKVKIYMMELLQSGIDLTNQENLNLVIKYVNQLILGLPPPTDMTPGLIDEEFLKTLYETIASLAKTTEQLESIKSQLQMYIKKLIDQGLDLTKKENLKLLVIFVQQLLNEASETPPISTEIPEVNSKILEYAYDLIYKLIINPVQRQSAIRYLHQYIKWAINDNFDLNDRENLNQLIILIISLVKNNESLIMPSTSTDPGSPALLPKEVEITYKVSTKYNVEPGNPGIVKYRVPYNTFVGNLRDILLRIPMLRTHHQKLEDELKTASKITEVSPELQKLPKGELIKLISHDGSFVDAKIPNDENIQPRNNVDAEEFDRMVRGLDILINRKVSISKIDDLRTKNDGDKENVEDLMKHYLLIHHDESFDPIAYLASGPIHRLDPTHLGTTMTNPTNTRSLYRQSTENSTNSVDKIVDESKTGPTVTSR